MVVSRPFAGVRPLQRDVERGTSCALMQPAAASSPKRLTASSSNAWPVAGLLLTSRRRVAARALGEPQDPSRGFRTKANSLLAGGSGKKAQRMSGDGGSTGGISGGSSSSGGSSGTSGTQPTTVAAAMASATATEPSPGVTSPNHRHVHSDAGLAVGGAGFKGVPIGAAGTHAINNIVVMTGNNLGRHRALVLDCAYRPINVVAWPKAVMMDWAEKGEVVDYYPPPATAWSGQGEHMLPAVIRVPNRYLNLNEIASEVACTRRNILVRDRFSCQYCGCTSRNLTLDHVVPVSKGGKNSWLNLVAACMPCNQRKGDKV
ncbi:hypothetical protein FOA52_005659 [Chlamydomonas sp. UWO 241]|nr:hypothetical protein FOA52_005659 [Chlamydomonas sp. UWO 241]